MIDRQIASPIPMPMRFGRKQWIEYPINGRSAQTPFPVSPHRHHHTAGVLDFRP